MEALLRFDNVSKQYPNGVHALNGVSFTYPSNTPMGYTP